MSTKAFTALLGAAMMIAIHPAWAHHSFAAQFDVNRPVTLTGVLTKMDWVNPHGWIHIDVTAADGTVEHWSVETGGPTQLLRRGLAKDDFPAGIEIAVKGFRAKDGSTIAHGQSVALKDGRTFFIGEIPIT